METIELKHGDFAGASSIKIVSIPSKDILDEADPARIDEIYRDHFSNLLSEIHQSYQTHRRRNGALKDVCIELSWLTGKAANQSYAANIDLFINVYCIDEGQEAVKQSLGMYTDLIKTSLKLQRYEYEGYNFGDYKKVLTGLKRETITALVKSERMEDLQNTVVPYAFSFDRIPDSDIDLSHLVGSASNNPGCVISFQLIPTAYSHAETAIIGNTLQQTSLASKGVMTQGSGMVSFTLADSVTEIYKYYNSMKDRPLFRYGIVVSGPKSSVNSIVASIYGQLNSGAEIKAQFKQTTIALDAYSKWNPLTLPWVQADHILNTDRDTRFWNERSIINQAYHRLPYVITFSEASEFFRLPVGSNQVRSGLNVNESKMVSRKYRSDIINGGDLTIGRLKSSQKDTIGIKLNDLCKHTFIAGTPGSGKTTFSISILDRLWREHKIPFLVIEPAKTEYRSMIYSIPELQIFTPGKDYISPFVFNPFTPPKNVKLGTYKSTLKTAFEAGVSMTTPLDKIFEESINNCYSDNNWLDTYTSDGKGQTFNITEFIKTFQETFAKIGYEGESRNIGRAGVVRLRSLVNLLDNYHTIPIEDILSKPTVIELAALENNEQKSLMIALILLSVLSYVNSNYAGDGKLKNVVLLEEAHVLLDQSDSANTDSNPSGIAQNLVKRMLAESRAYGIGLMVADQSPRKVGLDIVALTDIKVAFRIVESNDKDIVSNSTDLDDVQRSRLSKLRPGEAFLFFNKMDSPEEVIIDDYRAMNNIGVWTPDDDIRKLSKYWSKNEKKLRPYPECDYHTFCKNRCDYSCRILGREVARKIFKKKIGSDRNIEALNDVIRNFTKNVKENLNGEEYSDQLRLCVKVHFWRTIRYESKFNVSKVKVKEILETEK